MIIKLGVVQNHCFQFNLILVTNLQKQEDFLEDIQKKKSMFVAIQRSDY